MRLPREPGIGGTGVHGIQECSWCLHLSFLYYTHKAITSAQATELWHQAISHLPQIPEVGRIPEDNQIGLIHSKKNVRVRQCSGCWQQKWVSGLQ